VTFVIGSYRPKKKIVYLDTNFVIDLTKARLGLMQDPGRQMRSLYSRLASLVRHNKVVCPYGVFHDAESELSTNLRDEIRGTIGLLSGGIHWRHWQTILDSQVVPALYKYCGKEEEVQPCDWREAFYQDPDEVLDPDRFPTIESAIRAEFPVDEQGLAAIRASKQEYAQNMRTLPVREARRSYDDYLEEETRGFGALYKRPIAQLVLALEQGDPSAIVSACDAAKPTFRLYEWYLSRTGSERKPLALDSHFLAFFASPEIGRIPSVHILATLYAGLRFYYPKRTPRPGDANDVRMVAAYMPYCDILATDKFVRDITSRLALEREYAVAVYSLGPKDLPHLYQHLATL